MRIIRQGVPKEKRRECEYCGTLFAYNKTDIRTDIPSINDYFGVSFKYVVCPSCTRRIVVTNFN